MCKRACMCSLQCPGDILQHAVCIISRDSDDEEGEKKTEGGEEKPASRESSHDTAAPPTESTSESAVETSTAAPAPVG